MKNRTPCQRKKGNDKNQAAAQNQENKWGDIFWLKKKGRALKIKWKWIARLNFNGASGTLMFTQVEIESLAVSLFLHRPGRVRPVQELFRTNPRTEGVEKQKIISPKNETKTNEQRQPAGPRSNNSEKQEIEKAERHQSRKAEKQFLTGCTDWLMERCVWRLSSQLVCVFVAGGAP